MIRCRDEAILAIRGLLLVGDLDTTILTGGYVLRKSSKYSVGAELRAKRMAFGSDPILSKYRTGPSKRLPEVNGEVPGVVRVVAFAGGASGGDDAHRG